MDDDAIGGVVAALAVIVLFVGLPVAIVMLNDRRRAWRTRDRRTPAERQAVAAAFEARLLAPRWDEVARATEGGRPSPALVALYGNRAVVTSTGVSFRRSDCDDDVETVNMFLPADIRAFAEPWREHLPDRAFAFAVDDFGDFLFVELTPDGADRPVQHWYHDGGEVLEVAPSLAAFLASARPDATS
jgi:hypothetical protein